MSRQGGRALAHWSLTVWLGLLLFWGLACTATPTPFSPSLSAPPAPRAPLRLFIFYSADLSEIWAAQIRTGIIEMLVQEGHYSLGETLWLGEHRLASQGETMEPAITQALAAAEAFAPDAVITVGNQATEHVLPAYPAPRPHFVFCGVTTETLAEVRDLSGLVGVLERPYPVQTARLATTLVPRARQFMVLGDYSSEGAVATRAIFEKVFFDPPYPAIPVLRHTDKWEEWQAYVAEASAMDFVLLGKYTHVRDAAGMPVPPQEVLRWTLLNSRVPVFGLWQDTVVNGAVGGLVLLGEEQGRKAAQLLLQQLGGAKVTDLQLVSPERNMLAINLRAAEHWRLRPSFELLVTASLGGVFPTR